MKPDIVGRCWVCTQGLTKTDYGREASCPGCGKATRVCRNCRYYAPGRANDCLEPMAERILDKERANFCEYFDPSDRPSAAADRPDADGLRRQAEDLFK